MRWSRRCVAGQEVLVVGPPSCEQATLSGDHAIEGFVWRTDHRALPVTEVLAAEMAAVGAPRESIVVAPNGIDLADFPESLRSSIAEDTARQELTLGFVGVVREWREVDAVVCVLAAWQGHLQLRLKGADRRSARPSFKQLAAEHGIADRVRFIDLVRPEDISRPLGDFDIALQPASVPYALPLKMVECVAASCAIVATDQPNIREVLQDVCTALLSDPIGTGAISQPVRRLAGDLVLRLSPVRAAHKEILLCGLSWAGKADRIAAPPES